MSIAPCARRCGAPAPGRSMRRVAAASNITPPPEPSHFVNRRRVFIMISPPGEMRMRGSWSEHTIAGKRADIYTPPQPPRFGILYLHGIGLETLRDNPIYTRLFDELNL